MRKLNKIAKKGLPRDWVTKGPLRRHWGGGFGRGKKCKNRWWSWWKRETEGSEESEGKICWRNEDRTNEREGKDQLGKGNEEETKEKEKKYWMK